jgi:sugar/nucleoside kinase (ribokinase family)
LTIDEVISNGQSRIAPGGSAFYVSATTAPLGTSVDVVSAVGRDYPKANVAWLRRRGVHACRIQRKGETCRFRLSYRDGSRSLRIVKSGSKITESALDTSWGAIHLGPVFEEIAPSLVQKCRRHSNFVSVDLQGFLREKDKQSKVHLRPANLRSALSHVDLLKATIDEVLTQTRKSDLGSAIPRILRHGPKYLIVTLGRRGSVFAERSGRVFRVPAYPETNALDPTGAGDAMVGGWLATFLKTKDPLWAVSVGSALASLLVRRVGLAKFRWSKPELFRRSAWVYNRIGSRRDGSSHSVGSGKVDEL